MISTCGWIREAAETVYDEAVRHRRHLHAHPERSREEYETAAYLDAHLRSLGLEPRRVGHTGVTCDIQGTSTKSDCLIILRADTDALAIEEATGLPFASEHRGTMHACGHDLHTAGLLAAVSFLSKHRERFSGTLRVMFQHAEEKGGGARDFVAAGLCEQADFAFGVHVSPLLECGRIGFCPGPCNAFSDYFRLDFTGKSAHVSRPHDGIDALFVAAHTVLALQALRTRLIDPCEPVLLGVGRLDAGTAYNVLAASACVEGTIRTFRQDVREDMMREVERIAHAATAMYGGEVDIAWHNAAPALRNDPDMIRFLAERAITVFGRDAVCLPFAPSLWGDDMADLLKAVPGCYLQVGVADDDPASRLSLHHEGFRPAEAALWQIIGLHLMVASLGAELAERFGTRAIHDR